MNDIKILCKLAGGSHLYKLNTPTSDFDERGCIMSLDPKFILGTGRFDESRKQDSALQIDVVYKELGHFVRLLAQSNTEALEMLFAAKEVFTIYEKEFALFRDNASFFVDSRRLFNCLRGYGQSEYRLALGERKGQIGNKRADMVDKYGFSPKNCTQLLRLLKTGVVYFKENRYVVDCHEFGEEFYSYLYNIKTKPESYNKEQMEKDYKDAEKELVDAYENRKVSHHFNEEKANQLLLQCYFPALLSQYSDLFQKPK